MGDLPARSTVRQARRRGAGALVRVSSLVRVYPDVSGVYLDRIGESNSLKYSDTPPDVPDTYRVRTGTRHVPDTGTIAY